MALDARTLSSTHYCLQEISKNVSGDVTVDGDPKPRKCGTPPCETWTLVQRLHLHLDSADCDGVKNTLDGEMFVDNLTTVFTGLGTTLRGVHAANCSWLLRTGGSIAGGSLQGITNAGIIRPPPFQECETCGEIGILTGHLFITGTRVSDIPVPNFHVDAVYRLSWEPIAEDHQTTQVRGTLEGVIIMPCL